ncbi:MULTISPECIES: LuxR C-terminal-related transcriptional regulator [unclassified Serratia (in: enterobacteria)]|uniref:LuxR C-terminal-related transcriptional regulator n=1 Tax=unclassified Serratia (in: enterobacteria) TaxID=2647522 RepID=UPI000501201C|nr:MULTISPECIES: LuxR C-terminal-related transcriptional regulator [unclassified Serratia (in: enterobacteria)]KFK94086.1 hypothetical protein JV45_13730 [Serratia sp. Ag2]KFL00577.1 hypothetical protein IV04_00920 [Serratia sp. Ag1]
MEHKVSKYNVVILIQEPLTQLGMKQIAFMSAPGCNVYSDVKNFNSTLFTIVDMTVDLFITDMRDELNAHRQDAELLLELCHHHPQLKVIIYTQYLTPEMHELFQDCSQVSFLSRKAPLQEVYKVFAAILCGERYYNPAVIPKQKSLDNRVSSLTLSERRVLSFLLKGYSQSQIARLLCRSIKTISAQKCSTIKKLGFKRDAEIFLVRDALLNSL